MSDEKDIFSILAQPTETKTVNRQEASEVVLDFDEDFSADPIKEIAEEDKEFFQPPKHEEDSKEEQLKEDQFEEIEAEEVTPKIDPKKAEESAHSITTIVNSLNIGICTPLYIHKLKKKYGIKVNKKIIETALGKELMGQELSDKEKSIIAKFKLYEQRMALIGDKIPFEENEKKRIFDEARRLCEKKGYSVPAEIGFLSVILEVVGKRAIDIISI